MMRFLQLLSRFHRSEAELVQEMCVLNEFCDDQRLLLLPGLPEDVAKYCLALVPRSNFPAMGGVCRRWREFIQSREMLTVRRLAGVLEEWVYVLTSDEEKGESFWEVFDSHGRRHRVKSQMPGPARNGFGVAVLDGKLFIMGGYTVDDFNCSSASPDVYQHDSCLNRWRRVGDMKVARYDFGCAEVKGKVYVAGGYGADGESLSSVEVYDAERGGWEMIESMRRPRWGCFGCCLGGMLHVLGGRSSFTIGYSRSIDVYDPDTGRWAELKNGCVMVTAHAVLPGALFCIQWRTQRHIAVFAPPDPSWRTLPVPWDSSYPFRLGVLRRNLLLFSQFSPALLYDPDAPPGSQWALSPIRPSGPCLCTATVLA